MGRRDSPQALRAYNAAYYAKNKDRINKNRRDAFKRSPEKYRECRRAWNMKNPTSAAERSARWGRKNPDKVRRKAAIRRCRKLNGSVERGTPKFEKALFALVKALRGILDLHVDHIIPLSKNGTHTEKNLRLLPAKVNLSKGNRLDSELPTGLRQQVKRWTALTNELVAEYIKQNMARPKKEPDPKK